ncbi:ECF RNA polymerase sigma factor SigE [Planctomycetes bacterium Pla163]|uniref:ECF RNA polymerase sigma factor SigE n=1 Tax=Rohdeia mirabilis TaxID=2528008 RepID=A0A518D391_9BACT|nr:ECF RNA polymerase sigma factor SigE [Planctomycetes bacterium Pla163]
MAAARPRDEDFRAFVEEGDVEALARYFDVAAPRLLLIAAHLAPPGVEAEDLVQQTFYEALASRYEPRNDASVLSWMASILRHRAVDEARRRQRRRETSLQDGHDLPGREPDPVERLADDEAFELVVTAIDGLEPPQREVVSLRLVHGMDPATIAHTLGRKPATVRSQLMRGLERLRDALPAGIATAVFAAVVTDRGLAQVREAVLAEAVHLAPPHQPGPSASAPAPSFTLAASTAVPLAMITLLAAALLLLGPLLPESDPSTTVSKPSVAPTTSTPSGSGELAGAPLTLAERVEAAASTRRAVHPHDALTDEGRDSASITGSFLRPDGTPLSEGEVELRGWRNVAGEPLQSHEERVGIAQDGTFELTVQPAAGHQYSLELRAPDQVRARWRWSTLEPGSRLDLGTTMLPDHARVRVDVVDENGAGVSARWTIDVDSPWKPSGTGASTWRGQESLHKLVDSVELTLVPLGPCSIQVSTPATLDSALHATRVLAADTSLELVHAGPAPTGTICANLMCDDFMMVNADPQFIHLVTATGAPIAVTRTDSVGSRHYFEDLPDAPYSLVCDDPRFERIDDAELSPGAIAHHRLVGSSRVRLTVSTSDGSEVPSALEVVALHPVVGEWGEEWSYGSPSVAEGLESAGETSRVLEYCTLPGRQSWRISAEGWAPTTLDFDGELTPNGLSEAAIVLRRPTVFEGRVIDANGDAAPGARVFVRRSLPPPDESEPWARISSYLQVIQYETLHDVVTADDGSFFVPNVADEALDVLVTAGRGVWTEARALAPSDGPVTIRLPGRTRVEGRVETDADVDPSEFRVLLEREYDEGPLCWRDVLNRVRSDWITEGIPVEADGTFIVPSLALGEAKMVLRLTPARLPSGMGGVQTVWGACIDRVALDLESGASHTVTLDGTGVAVRSASVTVTVDGPTQAGLVVRAVGRLDPSIALAEGEDVEQRIITAAGVVGPDGVARVEPLYPGTWDFAVTGGNRSWQTVVARDVAVPTSGAEPLKLAFEVQVRRGILQLSDPDGAPLGRASVVIPTWGGSTRNIDTPHGRSSRPTDVSGRMELTLPPGEYRFMLEDPSNGIFDLAGTDFAFTWPSDDGGPVRVVVDRGKD